MSNGSGAVVGGTAASSAAAAHHRQVINATRALGAIVLLEPDEFEKIIARCDDIPLVVHAVGGWFSTTHQYLTNYKGIFFYTKSSDSLRFRHQVELIESGKIWIPA